ncbi:hypothetical protein PMI01_02327 [Caulobacter sp. AP07]|uniref:DUF2267 domain-containing protein n=1 Tax=Caulobacter sp. AP07 TaxID=1144304 RepID=UPI000271E3A4|nr:DUF2267 domain-containing protein [Caulobacter sp. AP07]EJL32998.1 hypothetical protein PMI01_02327 [Caulobacter sp. AP07]
MASSLPVFDTTVQETNAWLKAIASELGPCDRHQAYLGARATLHALRDRLTPDPAMNFAAQLPMLLRGMFTEGWRPSQTPTLDRRLDEFLARIEETLPPDFPIETESLARGVFRGLEARMDHDLLAKVIRQLPLPLRALWPQTLATL